jgi:RNA-directed DNA polymerase
VKVHYGEGAATHTGPESCALRCEASREALTGVCVGQVVSGESKCSPGVPMPSWQQKATGADAIAADHRGRAAG